jgi:RNase P subunit RPR2
MDSSPHLATRSPEAAAPRVPTPRRPLRHDQVLVTGDVRQERVIRTTDLHTHAREPIEVRYVTVRFDEVHQIQGVPLHDVLARADTCAACAAFRWPGSTHRRRSYPTRRATIRRPDRPAAEVAT